MTPLFVSFFTIGTGYEDEAEGLVESLDRFGLPLDVLPVPCFNSWTEACAHKPQFLLSMRKKHGHRPLVWLDADARVRQDPTLLLDLPEISPAIDFAAHWKDGEELLSGTLYFGATPPADRLLEAWWQECRKCPGEWDQRVLQRIVEGTQLTTYSLPAPYCLIFDTMRDQGPPVIEHLQASRRLKHQEAHVA